MAGLLGEILKRLVGSEIETSISLVKIQSAIAYLHMVKQIRRLAAIVCALVFFVVFLGCGMLLVPIALCMFMPWAPETRAIVGASFGAGYVVISLVVVLILFRSKLWMKASMIDKLLKDAARP
jgi:uncharacterized membrane protein (DUF485 family)